MLNPNAQTEEVSTHPTEGRDEEGGQKDPVKKSATKAGGKGGGGKLKLVRGRATKQRREGYGRHELD